MDRIDKIISSQTSYSRRQVQNLIKQKRVKVSGAICVSADQKLDPETAEITVDGETIIYKKHLYIMMNKPSGTLSASNDKNAITVIDLLPPKLKRGGLFPAGRLDKDTTGLMIITDDGNFAHNMLAPSKHVYKVYRATLSEDITKDTIKAFEDGITASDGVRYLPANLWTLPESGPRVGYVRIREGKFHQVKKMFLCCGLEVLYLHRIQIGNLYLDEKLDFGEARELKNYELSLIFS